MKSDHKDNARAARTTQRVMKPIPFERGMKFLDIGASIGILSSWARDQGCRVTAIEPFVPAYEVLEKVEGIKAKNLAVTADCRIVRIQLKKKSAEKGYWCNAHIERSPQDSQLTIGKDIKSVTLQSLINKHKPDITKIDIEGSEYEVIPVTQFSGEWVFVEFHDLPGITNTHRFPLCVEHLIQQGYGPVNGWCHGIDIGFSRFPNGIVNAGFWREILFRKGAPPPDGNWQQLKINTRENWLTDRVRRAMLHRKMPAAVLAEYDRLVNSLN